MVTVNYSDTLSSVNTLKAVYAHEVLSDLVITDSTFQSLYTALEDHFSQEDLIIFSSLKVETINTLLQVYSNTSPSLYGNLVSLFNAADYNSLSEMVSITDSAEIIMSLILYKALYTEIISNIVPENTVNYNSIYSITLSDPLRIKIPIDNTGEYSTFLLSPETRSVTTYTNYKFDGSCESNGKFLFYNSTGIYEYGGEYDVNSVITARLKTAALTLNNDYLKSVPTAYLGLTSDNTVILKVSTDGKGTFVYKLNKHTDNLRTQKVSIGKGIKGHYYQFELITDSTNFNLDSLEFLVVTLRREI